MVFWCGFGINFKLVRSTWKKRNVLKNQKGFTLIEIIAVLVILGILAAVAVPKFIDLQAQSREKALEGAVAAVKSQAVMDYASAILSVPAQASTFAIAATTGADRSYGDFVGGYTFNANSITITISAGEPDWNTAGASASFSLNN